MIDGTTASGGWSSFYNKAATALLPAVSKAHPSEWVSVRWDHAQTFGTLRPWFRSARPGRCRPRSRSATGTAAGSCR